MLLITSTAFLAVHCAGKPTDSSDRFLVEPSRATDSINGATAASRFPFSRGLGQRCPAIQQKAQDDIADASSEFRSSPASSVSLCEDKVPVRQSAIAAALDYCRTLARRGTDRRRLYDA